MAVLNIVLIEPKIPQNTGNIARTCACTGARLHIVKPMGFEVTDKNLKRSGLDYWHFLEIFYYENLDDFFEKNKERILSDDCPYFMIDALNCSDGCLCGTGVGGNISKEETLIRMMQLKTKISESGSDIWSEMDTPDKRLAALNKENEMLTDINEKVDELVKDIIG